MVAAEHHAGSLSHPSEPEYRIVPLRQLVREARRLDAELYLSTGFAAWQDVLRAFPGVRALTEYADVWQPGRLKGVQVAQDHGMPFVAATQVFDIWPTPRKWLAPNKTPDLQRRFVQPGWMLVTCSGSVGDTILSYSCHAGLVISHDLLRVVARREHLTGYLYVFLRTRYGRSMMRSSHYGNIIKHLEPEHLQTIPVPIIEDLVEDLERDTRTIYALRDQAYHLDRSSRQTFGDALGLPVVDAEETGYAVSAGRLFRGRRRLDAYAHNPVASAIEHLFEANADAVVPLGSVATAFVPGRFKRIFAESGIPYLDSEPIFKINPGVAKYLAPATAIDLDRYVVESGWVLVACSGQIYGLNGQAMLASRWHEGKVVTQHIMRLVPNRSAVRPGYLQVVLTHPVVGQPLVISRAHGTSVPELDPADIEGLPFPRLASDIENEIADMAERASELRMKADEQEDSAVARLERELDRRIGVPAKQPSKLRPDVAETAYRVMMEATGQAPKTAPPSDRDEAERNPEAVRRGKKGGRPRRKSG